MDRTSTSDEASAIVPATRGLTGKDAWLILPATAMIVAALAGAGLAPFGVGETIGPPFTGPTAWPSLGTDHLGRDVWSRILHGARRPIVVVPLVATAAATVLGGALGMLAAAADRRIGTGLIRVLDAVLVLPPVLVLVVLLYRFDGRSWAVILAVVVITTPFAARFAKAAATPILASGYVEQAVAIGDGRLGILAREVVPNLVGPLLADAGLRFIGAVYLTATAGFLGFGPAPPATDWGSMIAENIEGASLNPWAVVAPCLAIVALTVSANLLADRVARWVAR